MSQRNSGRERQPLDLYQTPAWVVTECLAPFIHLRGRRVWECAAGEGQMVRALEDCGANVLATDVKDYGLGRVFRGEFNFTIPGECPWFPSFDVLVTNPPYGKRGALAEQFVKRGLERIATRGAMALLLAVDFDSAGTRAPYFDDCPLYVGKIVLTKRIVWFPPQPGTKKSGPSQNHAWFLWSHRFLKTNATPVVRYAPLREAA